MKLAKTFLAMYFLTFAVQNSVIVAGFTLNSIALLFCFSLLLLSAATKKVKFRDPLLIILFFFACFVFALAISELPNTRVISYGGQIIVLLMLFALLDNEDRSPRNFLRHAMCFVIGNALLCANTVRLFFSGSYSYYRITSENYNPNYVAISVVSAIPWVIILFQNSRRRNWPLLLYLPLCVLTVFLTASRSGLIFLAIALVCALGLIFKEYSKRLKFYVIVIIILALPVLAKDYLSQIDLSANFERLLSTRDEISAGTLNQRTLLWSEAITLFCNNPLLGIGISQFQEKSSLRLATHNGYLSVLVEQGLFMFLLYCSTLYLLVSKTLKSLRNHKHKLMVSLSLLLALLSNLTAKLDVYDLFWVPLALSYFYAKAVKHQIPQSAPPPPSEQSVKTNFA